MRSRLIEVYDITKLLDDLIDDEVKCFLGGKAVL